MQERFSSGRIRPVFVVGYMHSGTTLVQNVIANSPAVFCAKRETKFFECLPMIRSSYRDLGDELVLRRFVAFVGYIVKNGYDVGRTHKVLGRNEGVQASELEAIWAQVKAYRDHTRVFRAVLDRLAVLSGSSYWLEKTPAHVYHIERIMRAMPDARIVIMVRDPRDILASKKTRSQESDIKRRYRRELLRPKRLSLAYDPILDSLSWKSAIRAGEIAMRDFPNATLSVRYEDLVLEPEARMRDVCAFLDLEFELSMLEVTTRGAADMKAPSKSRGIARDRIGRWQRVLGPTEIAVSQFLLKREMDAHRYTRVDHRWETLSILLLVGKSISGFLRRLYRKGRLAGLQFQWNTVTNWWGRLSLMGRARTVRRLDRASRL